MVRVRFAPSPTGSIHIGNVRAALFNYIFAKKHNGKLILRLEDTDLERSSEESAMSIINDLNWLGINFDEGPHIGGEYGPYKQTERLSIYKEYAEKLLSAGKAEKDYTTDNSYGIRFKAKKKAVFNDTVYGRVEKEVDDFIILKSNGIPTYHLGVVVDDSLMNITHVIRGKDHLDNTAKHTLLYEALNIKPPIYAHYSLTSGLSKRDKSKSIESLREKGYLPEAIINYSMLLGWSPKDDSDKFNIFDKLNEFDIKDLTKANSNFDEEKFNWLSGQYIREANLDRLTQIAMPYINYKADKEYINKIVYAVRNKLKCVSDIVYHIDFFFHDDIVYENSNAELIIKNNDSQKVIQSLLDKIKLDPTITEDNFNTLIKAVQKDTKIKGKKLFMPIRIALTGKTHGSEMNLVAPILGAKRCILRLEKAINKN